MRKHVSTVQVCDRLSGVEVKARAISLACIGIIELTGGQEAAPIAALADDINAELRAISKTLQG